MANTKISGLAELAETPASNDIYQIVDVSDTTMSLSGTNKYIQASRIVHQDTSGNVNSNGTASFLGALAIGTATPGVKLHVVGTNEMVRFTNTSATGDTTIAFSQLSNRRVNMGHEDINDVAFFSSWYGDVVLRAASTAGANTPTEYIRLKAGGNVGIGTASPAAKLEVVGTVQMDALRIDQTPTAGTFTNTHYITVNLNGTTYRIPCAV